MEILIAGCGYVGKKLGEDLVGRGHQVLGLRRDPAAATASPFPIRRGDLAVPGGLDALTHAPRTIVYCAAAESWHDEAYRLAYVEGPRRLWQRCLELGGPPRRFLFVSSTGVHHQDDGSWIDERSPTRPESFSGRRLLEGEAVVRAFDCETVILRCGGIYGPGRRNGIDTFLRGEARLDGGAQYGNRIHRDDVAGALRHLIELATPDDLYLGVDHDPASRDDVWRWLAVETGRPLPTRHDGDAPARRHGGSKRCRNDRLVASGYDFLYPSFREGFRALLAGDGR
ncbi:MAG: SDR family oxidoreductase [Planctomycetes bacterium]|nr:SDR family oxidoreductase [Planctomycetota bacterium]